MTIHFYDGGYADCSEIEVVGDKIYWDYENYYPYKPTAQQSDYLINVEWIEDDDGSDVTCDYISCSSKVEYHNYVKASIEDEDEDNELDLYDMIDYIDDNWDNCGCGEKMSKREAADYLGHSVRGMSKEEIDDEVSELQKAYYVDGEATDQEIIDMYNYMISIERK